MQIASLGHIFFNLRYLFTRCISKSFTLIYDDNIVRFSRTLGEILEKLGGENLEKLGII